MRKYSKPEIEVHLMDKQISLQASSENTGPGDPFGSAATAPPPEQQSALQDNPFDENNLK